MSRSARASLAKRLVERYGWLRESLTRRLGSPDLATEALHDAWIRIEGGSSELEPVAHPDSYLFRAALNSAAKLSAAERRVLGAVEISHILDLADDAPDAERTAIARSEVTALKRALASLTRRQRDIFQDSYMSDATHAELAERFGVSIRTIQAELRVALLHLASRVLDENDCANADLRVSRKR